MTSPASPMLRLMTGPAGFLGEDAPGDDVAISSRIRLARNLADFPFPPEASPEQLTALRDLVAETVVSGRIFGSGTFRFDVSESPLREQEILFERRLVSREFLNSPTAGTLIARINGSAGLMINEEDHLRLQGLRPGLALEEIWEEADKLESKLSRRLNFAFDETLGYLTSCPTNVGTGMRASVMLHLPGLVLSGQINSVVHGAGKLNLAVRGAYGEGTDNQGNLFQISNQSTLGESEPEIIGHLAEVIRQIIAYEKNARVMVLKKARYTLFDQVGRSYGLLRHAFTLKLAESLQALSWLRLGVDLGMFQNVNIRTVNELFLRTNPAHLSAGSDSLLSGTEADVARAALFRKMLGGEELQDSAS